ncbi:MAG TPA: tudor domain-containing protein [Gemmatimonadaceae bacterium]
MPVSDEDLRHVLTRAGEIQREGHSVDSLEELIAAGEAAGLTRPAIERAIQERFRAPPVQSGALVFARSADGKYYVAEVVSLQEDAVCVRFLRGSEHVVSSDQVRPCAFLPGERVVANWPWWGPWTCTVVSYDASRQKVKLSDGWGDTKSFPISDVWQTDRTAWNGRLRAAITWLSVGVGLGAVVGTSLALFLLRLT